MSYGKQVTLDVPFGRALEQARDALREQGFGVLTEIDVKKTMREKLDADMEEYTILGACNPPLAHRALATDRSIGLLLPCNVVVRAVEGASVVEVLDPHVLVELSGKPELQGIADDVARRLDAVLAALESTLSTI